MGCVRRRFTLHSCGALLWRLLLYSLLLARPSPAYSQKAPPSCASLYKQKKYQHAARCFEKKARRLGDPRDLPLLQRYRKGRSLRNAAISLEKAAARARQPQIASFLREQAVSLLRLYQKEKLCENANRCRTTLALETSIQRKIGYTPLTIVTNVPQALIIVQGHHYQQKGRGTWSAPVRPGPYQVSVLYPGQHKIKRRFQVRSGVPTVRTFQPPQTSPRPSPTTQQTSLHRRPPTTAHANSPPSSSSSPPLLAWVGYIGGGVLLVGGGVLLGITGSVWENTRTEWLKKTSLLSQRESLEQQRREALPLLWSGTALAGTGAVLLLAAVLLHTLSPPPSASPLQPSSHTDKTSTSLLLWPLPSPSLLPLWPLLLSLSASPLSASPLLLNDTPPFAAPPRRSLASTPGSFAPTESHR